MPSIEAWKTRGKAVMSDFSEGESEGAGRWIRTVYRMKEKELRTIPKFIARTVVVG